MKYVINGPEDYHLIPMKGVRTYEFPLHHTHNAIWDSNAGPDGKLYFALASEIATSGYVRFCRYDYQTGETEELFKIEDVILPQDRAIRASKFHSSICFMPDGRIVMTTHTTDKSPRHPTWMCYAYYHHLWEGFAGGNIIVYDPATRQVENRGIPVPHESIYGACYEAGHNALWFLGMMRGHLYRYSFDDRSVRDFGKVSENYSFRLVVGPEGNIYGASRTSHFYMVDTGTLEIRDLMYQFRHEPFAYSTRYNNLSIARTGPDNRLYIAVMYSTSFYAYDPATGSMEDLGSYLGDAERYSPLENRNSVFGMAFDSKGVLWYCVSSLNNYEEELEYGIPAGLFRWDITRGGKPEYMGAVGTQMRAGAWISEVCCTKEDILYITSSNHMLDGPQLIGIDLREFDPAGACTGPLITDPYCDPNDPGYRSDARMIKEEEECLGANPSEVQLALASKPVLLWRALAPDHIPDSAVKGLFWDDQRICGLCGEETKYAFVIEDGKLASICALEELPTEEKERITAGCVRADYSENGFKDLPNVPGRQYKAVASAAVELPDGKKLVGTADGLLALVSQNHTYAIGAPSANGPIHALSATKDGTMVYGISGDEEDIATLFSWDKKRGLRSLGYMTLGVTEDIDNVFYMTYATSLAVSPDGKFLAVASDERLGTVVIYRIS